MPPPQAGFRRFAAARTASPDLPAGPVLARIFTAALALAIMAPLAARAGFDAAARYSRSTGGLTVLVFERGKIFSDSRKGFSPATPVHILSITKSLTALAWLSRFPPDHRVTVSSDGRRTIAASALLSQTSGIAPGDHRIYRSGIYDIVSTAQKLPRMAATGTLFDYGPSHFELLGHDLERATGPGRNPLQDLLLARLGLAPAAWRTDRRGHPFLSAGACLSANDLLKIGRLVLNRGRAGTFSTLVPESRLTRAFAGSPANPAYGFGFWLNSNAAKPRAVERDIEQCLAMPRGTINWQTMCFSKSAPADMVCMAGSNGQRVYISRSHQLVIVRLGQPGRFRDPDFLRSFFTESAR
jgi:CubicO group peptidase (beta-lactamase class C family)